MTEPSSRGILPIETVTMNHRLEMTSMTIEGRRNPGHRKIVVLLIAEAVAQHKTTLNNINSTSNRTTHSNNTNKTTTHNNNTNKTTHNNNTNKTILSETSRVAGPTEAAVTEECPEAAAPQPEADPG